MPGIEPGCKAKRPTVPQLLTLRSSSWENIQEIFCPHLTPFQVTVTAWRPSFKPVKGIPLFITKPPWNVPWPAFTSGWEPKGSRHRTVC